MKKIGLFILSLCLPLVLSAQSVGLVLSGGGAKGLTHIGIIHALEDNDIPIDYVTGTSMGAIIGSLYAMGYTPDEMMTILQSKDFTQCYSGEIGEDNIYYAKQSDPTPEFYAIKAVIKDSIRMVQALPTSLIDPLHMNMLIFKVYAQANAACGSNFDKLFIPFRCVASDVYNKKELIFKDGDLGSAVRASMTFPLVFKPLKINGVLAYDGGMYNNFPADVMERDFHPDFTIGSVVSGNSGKPDENNIIQQVESMIMSASNYELVDSSGILMKFDFKGEVGLLSFDKIQYLHDVGYAATMELMDSIKQQIPRRIPLATLNERRRRYKEQLPHLIFKNINVKGTTDNQREYVINEIRPKGHKYISFDEFKKAYYRLLSDKSISEITPTSSYNPTDKTFDLNLDINMHDNLSFALGGNISTNNVTQAYYGLNYNYIGNVAGDVMLDGQLGRIYNNIQLSSRLDIVRSIPLSFRLMGSFSTINYNKQGFLFSNDYYTPNINKQKEAFIKLKVSLPFLTHSKMVYSLGYGELNDLYVNKTTIDLNNIQYDANRYRLLGGAIAFKRNTLNSIQYATKGSAQHIIAQIFTGTDLYKPGQEGAKSVKDNISWLQFSYMDKRYFQLPHNFTLGTHLEAFYSSHNLGSNYTATMLQAGTFAPIPSSIYTYNSNFRANQYLALGIIPIYNIAPHIQARIEAYGFLPIYPINRNAEGHAVYGKAFSRFSHMEELSVVGQFSTIAVGAFVNYNCAQENGFSAGITIGWNLFNERFIER